MAPSIKIEVQKHVDTVLAAVSDMTVDGTMCDVMLSDGLKANATLLLAACTKMASIEGVKAAMATSSAAKHIVTFIHRRTVELKDKDASFELFKLSQSLGVEDCERACHDSLRGCDKIVIAASKKDNQMFFQRISQYYQEGTESDCQLEVLDEKEKMINFRINIHKVIVGAAVSYLRPLWTGNFDITENHVKLPDITKDRMLAVLNLIYGGEAYVDQEDIMGLYLSIDRLCVLPHIVDAVLEKLKAMLNMADAMRFSSIETPCPLALRKIALQQVLQNKDAFLSGAHLGTYASIADLEAAESKQYVDQDWFKLPFMLNMVNILKSPCINMLGVDSVARLLSCLKDWGIQVQQFSLSMGMQVRSKQDFTIKDGDNGEIVVKLGEHGTVDTLDAEGNAQIKLFSTGKIYPVHKKHFDRLESLAELTVGAQVQVLPGESFQPEGKDCYREHDIGTVSEFRKNDEGQQRFTIVWERSGLKSSYPTASWLDGFRLHQTALGIKVKVHVRQSFGAINISEGGLEKATIRSGEEVMIKRLLHPVGDALIELRGRTYRVQKSSFHNLEVREKKIELDAKMMAAALLKWSQHCQEPSQAGCLEAQPDISCLNQLFAKLSNDSSSFTKMQELFQIAFSQAIGRVEGVSLTTACDLLQPRSKIASPLKNAAESVIKAVLSELVKEEVEFSVDDGLTCSVDASWLLMSENRHAFIMHIAAHAASKDLPALTGVRVSSSALVQFLKHTAVDGDELQAFLISLCEREFDVVLDALCHSEECIKNQIRDAMSLWRKQVNPAKRPRQGQ